MEHRCQTPHSSIREMSGCRKMKGVKPIVHDVAILLSSMEDEEYITLMLFRRRERLGTLANQRDLATEWH